MAKAKTKRPAKRRVKVEAWAVVWGIGLVQLLHGETEARAWAKQCGIRAVKLTGYYEVRDGK